MPFGFRRSNSSGSNRSIDTSSPPDSPTRIIEPTLPNTSNTTNKTGNPQNSAGDVRNNNTISSGNENHSEAEEIIISDEAILTVPTNETQNETETTPNSSYILEPQVDPDIPPDTDEWGNTPGSKKRFRARDTEPILYQDKFVAISATYLYILNYFMPDAKDKAIPMTSIRNVQTDREARISDMAYQKWGSGGFDLWWARDLGRWKNHDLCVIVTVERDWVKRKGFTLEHAEGLKILKKAWQKAKGIPEQND
ncbi:6527_t:CDS:2 [Ambispora leptoticha]|uniref:6527_t:CDS:1 n=1 Tax=Ambispora leptoticha TaxID=144679 RepID=A0A9N8Z9T2_9GLOM|nr:6527_t:CDS:2 [Ambispora leptoticha]